MAKYTLFFVNTDEADQRTPQEVFIYRGEAAGAHIVADAARKSLIERFPETTIDSWYCAFYFVSHPKLTRFE